MCVVSYQYPFSNDCFGNMSKIFCLIVTALDYALFLLILGEEAFGKVTQGSKGQPKNIWWNHRQLYNIFIFG